MIGKEAIVALNLVDTSHGEISCIPRHLRRKSLLEVVDHTHTAPGRVVCFFNFSPFDRLNFDQGI